MTDTGGDAAVENGMLAALSFDADATAAFVSDPRRRLTQAVRHVINAGQVIDLDGAATSQLLRRYEKGSWRPVRSVDYSTLCIATSGIGDSQTASVAAPMANRMLRPAVENRIGSST